MIAPLPTSPRAPAPPRPRTRRHRRADSARRPIAHVVMPGLEVARAEIKPRESIAAFLRRTGWAWRDRKYGWQFKKGLPTVLEINGEAILRKFWRTTRLTSGDVARFVSFPLGGGGASGTKQIAGLVALVAVSAFAIWAGPLAASALGFAGSSVVGGLATAAIGLGGSLLVNALVHPDAGATNAPSATQNQIYSVAAQGNTARLGQPLPVWYGQLLTYPDFAVTPWSEFIGNDEYLNILLSVGMGSLDYQALYVDQTVLWDPSNGISATFNNSDGVTAGGGPNAGGVYTSYGANATGNPGCQVAFYEAGAAVTLFPVNVFQSSEVSGQQFPDGTGDQNNPGGTLPPSPGAVLGPFVTNPSATLATLIVVDFVFPGGCYTQNNNDPTYRNQPFRLIAQYAPVNDAGAVTGAFTTLFDITRTYNSNSPIRDSVQTAVAPGRYTVRVQRGDQSNVFGASACLWAGLRSFLQGSNSFPDVATVAIRILADLSTQGSWKFGVLATRKLPVWNGSAFVTQATRNPFWAFLDAVTNTQYGSTLPIAKVDFNTLVTEAANADSRGDYFDYFFNTAVAVPAAWDKMLTVARSRHYWLGDTVSVVRDEWRDVPSMLLTDREIVRDSTQVTWTMLGDEDPDAVIVEYIDSGTWLPAQVQYPPNSGTFTAANAETKRIDGITDRNQAYRECAFYYLQSIYRRENVQINVEYEGRAITFGAVLRLQSELPQAYGYAGAVVSLSGDALTLDPAPTWHAGPFYIRLRQPNGTYFGPVLCTQGSSAGIANLDPTSLASAQTAQSTTLAAVLARETGGEYPSFELGTADSESKLCVVLSGVPNGELCTLTLVVDDQRVHATDLGDPPSLPSTQYPANASLPLIAGLNASFSQGIAEPQLSASWFPTAGAVYYIALVSYDGGNTFIQVYEGQDNKFSAVVTLAALTLKVQAVTQTLKGPFSSIALSAPTIQIASDTVALQSLTQGIQYQITTLQNQFQSQITALEAAFADALSQVAARTNVNKKLLNQQSWDQLQSITSTITAVEGALTATITSVQTVATNTQAALASYETTVSAEFASANASIASNATALATLDTSFSSFSTSTTASLGSLTTSVTTNESSIATLNGQVGSEYSVTLNTNGYATGFNLIDGTGGVSTFTVVASQFQIQLPGYNGNSPQAVFTTGTLGGSPAIGIHGNLFLDGTLNAEAIVAGTITATLMAANSITAANGAIAALAVQSLNIQGGAVTVPVVQTLSSDFNIPASTSPFFSFNLSIDTTGLSGATIPIYVYVNAMAFNNYGYTESASFYLSINGTQVAAYSETLASGGLLPTPLAGAINITGTGGVVTVAVAASAVSSLASSIRINAGATIFAMAAKR